MGDTRRAYRFGGFALDLGRGALFGPDGGERTLRPKAFALLSFLAARAEQLVGRAEILAALWPGVTVTGDSVTRCVMEIRRALGDGEQRLLRAVPRRGYILTAAVSVEDAPKGEPPAPPPRRAFPPVLAVLPFGNMTGDPQQDYLVDGLGEELTTELSHLRWFAVISRSCALGCAGRGLDIRGIGAELGADYLLDGSVRRAGERLRLTARLSEAATARQVWAERFDGEATDVFDLQDRLAAAVVGAMEPTLQLAEVERARARPTESLDAYDLYLRALPHRYTTRAGNDEARRLLLASLAADGGFVVAHGELAGLHTFRHAQGWSAPGDGEEAVRSARAVVETAGSRAPSALAAAARALSYLGGDFDGGLAAAERALSLAPNSAAVLLTAGWLRIYVGDPEAGLDLVERAKRRCPAHPSAFLFHTASSLAHFMAGRYVAAAEEAGAALSSRANYMVAQRLRAASLGLLGDAGAARDLLAVAPGYTLREAERQITAKHPADRDRLLRGLRRAGLPEA